MKMKKLKPSKLTWCKNCKAKTIHLMGVCWECAKKRDTQIVK